MEATSLRSSATSALGAGGEGGVLGASVLATIVVAPWWLVAV